MNILVCDDDKAILEHIKKLIDEFKLEYDKKNITVDYFQNPNEALNNYQFYSIAILDIEMPEKNGITLAQELRKRNPQLILIYLTSYPKYVDDAFDINASRFFEKPVNKERFFKGLKTSVEKLEAAEVNVFLKNCNKSIRLDANKIIFIEVHGHGTKIITQDGDYNSVKGIKYYEEKLTGKAFVPTHRSFIINLNFLASYDSNCAFMLGEYTVPISRRYKSNFKKKLLDYFGEKL